MFLDPGYLFVGVGQSPGSFSLVHSATLPVVSSLRSESVWESVVF